MGDRITTYYPCPKRKCKGEVEEYDASSSLTFVSSCDTCDWRDDRTYYEISSHEIILCTKEEARKEGGLVICKNCKREVMGSYIKKGGCLECKIKN